MSDIQDVQKEALEAIDKTLQALADSLNMSVEQMEQVHKALVAGEPLYRILGIAESTVEARYALAYQLYNAGNYTDAEVLFRWLCTYANTNVAHWMGLGATRQAQKNYTGAMEAYQLAAAYSALTDPAPFFYLGLCSLKLKRTEDAEVALQTVHVLADPNDAEHKKFIEMANALLKGLQTKDA